MSWEREVGGKVDIFIPVIPFAIRLRPCVIIQCNSVLLHSATKSPSYSHKHMILSHPLSYIMEFSVYVKIALSQVIRRPQTNKYTDKIRLS